ncbi:MAG: phospholipid carrier-dependent glycosyltransferase [Hyphomicrobiales bacterium]|nr:MAG: phospholipid carrier-dependent glycosyltransferase [Hyphomicrobiales bacterium]
MAEVRSFDWRLFRALALIFFAAKLVLLVAVQPFMDETYYWLWGQHPDLSYFDHPPMVGWTAGLASVFGWNIVALRLPVLLTLLGDLWLLHALARHLRGEAWREAFWPTAALFLATPIIFGLTALAMPDHLLIFFALLAVYAIERFRTGYEAGVPRWRFLYLAAFAIGCATLSKYTGALLALGVVAIFVFTPRLRSVWRSPHVYLAALLAIAMQAPVIAWNLQHDLASFGFIVGGRRPLPDLRNLTGLTGYLAGIPFVFSPFLLWALIRFLGARGDGHGYARWVFWASTLGFLAASFFTNILIHWNILAYVVVLPFLFQWLRSRWLVVGHFVYGALLALVMAANFAVTSVQGMISFVDQTTAWSYGWEKLAPEIRGIAVAEGATFVATTDYALAGPLAFALGDRDVTSLSPRTEAFDYWFDAEAHRGQDAIILADRWRGLGEGITSQFASVELVKRLDVQQFGKHVNRYEVYIARAYSPPSQ